MYTLATSKTSKGGTVFIKQEQYNRQLGKYEKMFICSDRESKNSSYVTRDWVLKNIESIDNCVLYNNSLKYKQPKISLSPDVEKIIKFYENSNDIRFHMGEDSNLVCISAFRGHVDFFNTNIQNPYDLVALKKVLKKRLKDWDKLNMLRENTRYLCSSVFLDCYLSVNTSDGLLYDEVKTWKEIQSIQKSIDNFEILMKCVVKELEGITLSSSPNNLYAENGIAPLIGVLNMKNDISVLR